MYGYYLSPLFAATHAHPWLQLAVHTHMFLAGCLLSWYLIGRDPLPRRASTRTTLVVLLIAAGSHDLLSKLMYAHLLPHGGGTPAQLRAGAQLMFYGGDAIEIALSIAVMSAWYARGGRQLSHARRRGARVSVE
jgi:putative membrane protein